jgi:hypothetical protein
MKSIALEFEVAAIVQDETSNKFREILKNEEICMTGSVKSKWQRVQ